MNGRVALVTGAGGFIGSRLCEALRGTAHVRALARTPQNGPWDELIVADLTGETLPRGLMSGVDTVYHLAARTHAVSDRGDDEVAYRRVNVDATRRLCEAARNAGVRRFVFASSVKAMGEGGTEPVRESDAPRPTTWYGRTKREAETIVLDGGYIPEPVVLRLAMVYGPGAPGNLAAMIRAIDTGWFPPVPPVPNRRSMVHADDAVAALVLAAQTSGVAGRTFTVTDGQGYSTRQMVELIHHALGREMPGWSVPMFMLRGLARAGDLIGTATRRRWKFDSAAFEKLFGSAVYEDGAIRDALGFRPQYTLEAALPAIVDQTKRG